MYFHDRPETADAPHTLEWPWYDTWVCAENPAHFQLVTDADYRENRGATTSSPPLLPDDPRELLFQFIRASDRAPITCELRFNGQSFLWEVQFLERGELFYSRGNFLLRETAIRWAEQERDLLQRGSAL